MSWLQQSLVSKPSCMLLREKQDQRSKGMDAHLSLGFQPGYWDVTVDTRQLYKGGIGMCSPTLKTRMIPIYQDV